MGDLTLFCAGRTGSWRCCWRSGSDIHGGIWSFCGIVLLQPQGTAMMHPTREYLNAHDVGRTRPEATHGPIRVVIENYSDAAYPFGKSMVYLSMDAGATVALLDWKVSWLDRWKKSGRLWPPHHLQIDGLDEECLRVTYFDAIDDSPPNYKIIYEFAEKKWKL